MWIRRVKVANWRGLELDLPELSPGLNLISGPNEAGKSRLVEALRFAFFESSSGRSAHKKALATWGPGAGKPEVTVEFDLAGTTWTVHKEFLGTGNNTRLRSSTASLDGAEAEARLAELLGAGPAGRVELKPEDRGVWSLLWVEQGASREAPTHNETSQTHIQDSLTREIGEVAAGELGQRVLAAAEEQRNRFYTTSRDAEKTTLTEPREQVARLRQRLEEAIVRRDGIAADADELDRQRTAERDLTARLATAQARREQLHGRHDEAIELGRRLELADEQVRTAEASLERARLDLDAAQGLAGRLGDLTDQAAEARRAHTEAEARRQTARQAFEAAGAAADEAGRLHSAQDRLVTALRRRRELMGFRERAGRLRSQLEQTARAAERAAALQDELGRLPPIDADAAARLRRARDARDTARARLEGASATVEIEARRDLSVSGEALTAGTTRRVLVEEEQRLEIDGIATITVQPGGGELPRLRDAARDAERALSRLLTSLAVTDAAQAERVAERRRDIAAEIDRCRDEAARYLPQGRDAAEAELRELSARLETAGDADEPVSEATLDEAVSTLGHLSGRRDALRAKRDAAADGLAAAREDAAHRRAQVESAECQLAEMAQRLAGLADRQTLEARLADAERAWKQRVAGRDELEVRFEALGGEDLELDVEQADRACRQLADDLQNVRVRAAALQARLEARGDDGRHEQVQELEAALLAARTELARVERQAAAARRLHEVLKEEFDAARERLTEPVIARIRPYLQGLFPDSRVWLDDDLNLKGLRSRDSDQEFEALSGGAREQLSLLVRIALAQVIGADEPWPLVLDDVLVNTDAERIQRVQRVLFQAARKMQILLFTCHGPLFDGLGADMRIELPPARTVVSAQVSLG